MKISLTLLSTIIACSNAHAGHEIESVSESQTTVPEWEINLDYNQGERYFENLETAYSANIRKVDLTLRSWKL